MMDKTYQYVGSGEPVSLGVLLASEDVNRGAEIAIYDAGGGLISRGPWYKEALDLVDVYGSLDRGYATLEREGVIRFQLDPERGRR